MKNIAKAERPKSAISMLPPRPFRVSGKVAHTDFNSDRRQGKSCIPTVNQTFADSQILKIPYFWNCWFFGFLLVAFSGAMAIAWSQIDVGNKVLTHDLLDSFLHSRWIYALPMPVFFALSGTLVYEWFSDFDKSAVIAANFVVSSLVLIPVAAVASDFGGRSHFTEQSTLSIAFCSSERWRRRRRVKSSTRRH